MVWMSECVTAIKTAVIRGLLNDAIYLRTSSIKQVSFLGLICQPEATVTMLVVGRR